VSALFCAQSDAGRACPRPALGAAPRSQSVPQGQTTTSGPGTRRHRHTGSGLSSGDTTRTNSPPDVGGCVVPGCPVGVQRESLLGASGSAGHGGVASPLVSVAIRTGAGPGFCTSTSRPLGCSDLGQDTQLYAQ